MLDKVLKKAAAWVYDAIEDKRKAPVEELKGMILDQGKRIDRLAERVETLHKHDEDALECDLSVMDDRICFLIRDCRRKGYTTADDRRRIGRMHEAYRKRGGNHGEEVEYKIFEDLPTEEDYNRDKKEKEKDI